MEDKVNDIFNQRLAAESRKAAALAVPKLLCPMGDANMYLRAELGP